MVTGIVQHCPKIREIERGALPPVYRSLGAGAEDVVTETVQGGHYTKDLGVSKCACAIKKSAQQVSNLVPSACQPEHTTPQTHSKKLK